MYEEIIALIGAGKAKEARVQIDAMRDREAYDLELCILDATASEAVGDLEAEREAIAAAMRLDPYNYELFYMLGLMYAYRNVNQAYLCFEQAEHYCDDPADIATIRKTLLECREKPGCTVRNISVMVLSYNDKDLMIQCIETIRAQLNPHAYELVVVDNASDDGIEDWLRDQKDIRLIENGDNVGFPVGCNIGFRACSRENDILFLNNDTIAGSNALFWMRMGLYEDRTVGATGAMSNVAAEQVPPDVPDTVEECLAYARKHNVPMAHPYETRCRLTGFAVLVKKEAWEQVALGKDLMDPVFSPGYFEDDDLGVRISQAGFKQLLCHNAFIYHQGGSGFASHKDALLTGRDKFIDKWGFDIWAYEGVLTEMADQITENADAPVRVLEVGCGMGVNLSHIRYRFPHSFVAGTEPDPVLAGVGKYMADIVIGDMEIITPPWSAHSFDYIFAGDVLKHALDPEKLKKRLEELLAPGGKLITE